MSYATPRNNEVAPIVTEKVGNGGSIETTVTHPAFGQVSVSRRQHGGGGANLYDSDFGHNSYVVVEVKHSRLDRDLSRDWHFPQEEIVQFALSESQWATMVSSFNSGSGTPCTLLWEIGKGYIPGIPAFDRAEVFKKDMREKTSDAVAGIKKLIADIEALGLSKKKTEELLAGANASLRALNSSLPFVEEQFNEHVEATVERGKQEVHGYMNGALTRAGIAALNGGLSPLEIQYMIEDDIKDGR